MAALTKVIFPEDILGASSCGIDTKLQRFNDVIMHRIELPENVSAMDYANKIRHVLNSIKFERYTSTDRIIKMNFDILARYGLEDEECFYKLAKHNPEIALEFFMGGGMSVSIELEVLLSINIETYVMLIKTLSPRAGFMKKECTHEELEILVDRLGVETTLKHCYFIPEMEEKIKEIADPLIKCATKVT